MNQAGADLRYDEFRASPGEHSGRVAAEPDQQYPDDPLGRGVRGDLSAAGGRLVPLQWRERDMALGD